MMDYLVKAPIVVISADGEVMVFGDVASAEAYMEPIDVKRGEYAQFTTRAGEHFISRSVGNDGFWAFFQQASRKSTLT